MRVAAVDIGTNTVRLLVANCSDTAGSARVDWVDRRDAVTRLGEGVDGSGMLSQDAMGRTLAVLSGYRAAIQTHDIDAAVAVATSASRDATNGDEFLERAQAALGFRPSIITGEEEASLSFYGTTHTAAGPPPYLVIDPGGGSTEFVMGKERPDIASTIDIGSVRLTERRLPNRPATVGQLAAARSEVRRLLDPLILQDDPGSVFGVGGTFTTLAAMADPAGRIDGVVLTAAKLSELVDRLSAMTIAETAATPGVHPQRAEVLLGGAVVAEMALAHVGAVDLRVSERDLLDGIILRAAGAEGTDRVLGGRLHDSS